jgi:threonine-phosphate decarboxylase
MNLHGGDIYSHPGVLDFSSNCNCYGMPQSMQQAALRGVMESTAYPDPAWRDVLSALADYEKVRQEQLICGNGASELLLTIVSALTPKKALLFAPEFSEYERVLRICGTELQWQELTAEENYQPSEAFLKRLRETDAELVMFSNPNNPTGALLQPDYLKRVQAIARERGIIVVVDECFLDFLEQPERYSMKRYLDDNERLVIVRAFTKTFACAGLRLGYLLCKNQEILCKCKDHLPQWNLSLPAGYAGIAATKERQWLLETTAAIRTERGWLAEQLTQLGFRVYPGAANYLFFTGAPGLYEHCLSHGILIRDCSNYRGLDSGSYRVCVRMREDNERLLEVFKNREKTT